MSTPLVVSERRGTARRRSSYPVPPPRRPSILDKIEYTIIEFKGKYLVCHKVDLHDLKTAVQNITDFCKFSRHEKFRLRTEALFEFSLNNDSMWRKLLELSPTMSVIQDEPENTQRGTVCADKYLTIVDSTAGNQIRSVHVCVHSVSDVTKRDITVVSGPRTTVGDVLKEYIRMYDKPSELDFRWMGGADILNPSTVWNVYEFRDGEVLHEVLPL